MRPVQPIQAPAKLNLTLRVEPPRDDGFHPIESLVVQIGLCDELSATPRDDGQVSLICDDPRLPTDEQNLVVRAAQRLRGLASLHCGANLQLRKRIPAGAGLGGGSSDAAAALLLLNECWELHLSRDELCTIAAQLGSDIPLFLHPSPAWLSGRGEIVSPWPVGLRGTAVLILPPFACPTAEVYRTFDALPLPPARPTRDEIERRLARTAIAQENPSPLALPEVDAACFNDLREAATVLRPQLAELSARSAHATGRRIHLSGSGSCLFLWVETRAQADESAELLRARLPAGVQIEVAPILESAQAP